jgi:predicted nucleic acid-binding protein
LTIVVDASVAAAWLVADARSEEAVVVLAEQQDLIAPDLLIVEVANALWKRILRDELAEETAEKLLTYLTDAGLDLVPSRTLILPGLRLAYTLRHPIYDCLYLALAQDRSGQLATLDKRMAAAAGAIGLPLWAPNRRPGPARL